MPLIPYDQIPAIVAKLSYQDKERILANLVWDLFGTVDDEGAMVIDTDHRPTSSEVLGFASSYREELWPPRGDTDTDTDTTSAETPE